MTKFSNGIVNAMKKATQPVAKPVTNAVGAGVGAVSNTVVNNQSFDTNAYLQKQQDMINSIYNQQRDARLAEFKLRREKAVGEINQQKGQVAPQYQNMRNQSDVQNAQSAMKLREMMAANGLNASGENVSAHVALSSARQNALNSLNLQEQETINDYDRRISDLMNPAEENALIAALEAERAKALYDGNLRADETAYSRMWNEKVFNNDNYWKQVGQDNFQKGFDRNVLESDRSFERGVYESDRGYNRGVLESDRDFKRITNQEKLAEEWRLREWNKLSPAEKDRMALQYSYSKKGSGGGGGGSRGNSYSTTTQTKTKTAEDIVKEYMEAVKNDNLKKMANSSLGEYWTNGGFHGQNKKTTNQVVSKKKVGSGNKHVKMM